jgi:outer membrane lipoprotein-sorting protein
MALMRSLVLAMGLLAAGCPGHGQGTRTYPAPSAADVVARLAQKRAALTSFKADTTMDYWLGNQRAKGEVLVMAKTGSKIRFAALSPAGGSTLAEMACDGKDFVYVDYQNNCALTGPCNGRSIAQFFHIELEPDDFLHLALGTPPVVPGATGTVTWDASSGHEKVALHGTDGATQKLTIDARDNRWDVLDSTLTGADGKVRWSVANTDFGDVGGHRVPGKTRFRSPADKQDLIVDWTQRQIDVELSDDKFVLQAPAGLATCGRAAPAGGSGQPAPSPAPAR